MTDQKIRWNFPPELREHMRLSAELAQLMDDFYWQRAQAEMDRRIKERKHEA